MAELRITDTNSANDSKGRAFGLEGNDFVYILVAVVVSMGLYLVCSVVLKLPVMAGIVLAMPVCVVPAAWVLLLRHNKPAGYAEDWFEQLVNREGWSFAPRAQIHPRRTYRHEQSRT